VKNLRDFIVRVKIKVTLLNFIEFFLVIVLSVFLVIFVLFPGDQNHPEFIPNAISGLTTMSGILTAFVGYWLVHFFNSTDGKNKILFKRRLVVIIISIFIGLLAVVSSSLYLVYENSEGAFTLAISGLAIILCTVIEIFLIILALYFPQMQLSLDLKRSLQ
jgi:hypothetical protein